MLLIDHSQYPTSTIMLLDNASPGITRGEGTGYALFIHEEISHSGHLQWPLAAIEQNVCYWAHVLLSRSGDIGGSIFT